MPVLKYGREIWLHPENDMGYSGGLAWKDAEASVVLCRANRIRATRADIVELLGSSPKAADNLDYQVVILEIKGVDLRVMGGDPEAAEFRALADDAARREWVYTTFLRSLTPEWLRLALDEAYARGAKAGRNDIRAGLAGLLEKEF